MKSLKDSDPMPFGCHKDKPMEKVPAGYLDWFVGQPWADKYPSVVDYVNRNRNIIDKELKDAGLI